MDDKQQTASRINGVPVHIKREYEAWRNRQASDTLNRLFWKMKAEKPTDDTKG